MAAPRFINELTAVTSLSSAAAVHILQAGVDLRTTAGAFISQMDSFTASGTGAVSRTVAGKLQERVSVLDYIPTNLHAGIKAGTDTSDLTAYFQAALDAVTTAGGGEIFVPEGTYYAVGIDLTSCDDVALVGEFRADIQATAGSSIIRQFGTTGDLFFTDDYPTVTYGTALINLALIGNLSAGTTGRGVYLSQGSEYCAIKNCVIRQFPQQGVVCAGQANTIERNFIGINNHADNASFTFYKGQLEVYGVDHFVDKNELSGNATAPLDGASLEHASLYSVAMLVQSAACLITRNVCELADTGLVMLSRHTAKTGAANQNDPYYPVSCHSNLVAHNRVDQNLGHGIWLISTDSASGPYMNHVFGNTLFSNGRATTNTYDGIFEDAVGAVYPYKNTIAENKIYNSVGATNLIRYGINTAEAVALQTTAQKTMRGVNYVDSDAVATARYNGGVIDLQGSLNIGDAVGDSHAFTGIVTMTDDSASGLSVIRSSSGDRIHLGAFAATSGAQIYVVNNGQTDFEPFILKGETLDFQYRTGVLTSATALSVNTSGHVSVAKKLFPPKDDATAQTAAGIYAGSGAPNNSNGSDGDFYFRSDGTVGADTVIYHKEGGSWVACTFV